MEFTREMWVYLLLLAVGSLVYVSFGDYSMMLYESRVDLPETRINGLGLDYEIFTRVHLFGLFFGVIGLLGLLVKLRKLQLIP